MPTAYRTKAGRPSTGRPARRALQDFINRDGTSGVLSRAAKHFGRNRSDMTYDLLRLHLTVVNVPYNPETEEVWLVRRDGTKEKLT